MQTGPINSHARSIPAKAMMPMINGRPDQELADALTKVSPQAQAKTKATATDFEAMFLNSMFAQMTSGIKGEGPFGDTPGTGVWRSMLTEQYSKSFAKAGGARRQCRDSAPQYSQHLYCGGTARGAGPVPHHAARAQPVALISFGFVFANYRHFSSNLRAGFSAAFIAFSNKALIAAGHSCCRRGVGI